MVGGWWVARPVLLILVLILLPFLDLKMVVDPLMLAFESFVGVHPFGRVPAFNLT